MPAERDPYEPPNAALQSGEPRRGAPLNALLAGFLIVFAGTVLGGTALRFATLLPAVQARFDHEHLAVAMRASTAALGGASAFLGGLVCARIARRREAPLGATLGVLAAGLTALAGAGGGYGFPAAIFLLALLGTWSARP